MPTLNVEVVFEVYCSCGEGLGRQTKEGENRHSLYIEVEPCDKCLNKAYNEGYDNGEDDGKKGEE